MDMDTAATTVPPEYDGFSYVRPDALPLPLALSWLSLVLLAAVGLVAPLLVSAATGSTALAIAVALVATGFMGVLGWLQARTERREESLRREPACFYRTVEDLVGTESGHRLVVRYREYADGTRSEPRVTVAP